MKKLRRNHSKEIQKSIDNVKFHFGKVKNNNDLDLENNINFSETSLKRSRIKDEELNNYDFSRAAFTGSVFSNTKFIDCDFDGAVAEFCDFYDCDFIQNELDNNSMIRFNFSNSNFIDCHFNNIGIFTSSLTNSLFKNVCFEKCSFELSSFENSTFDNVIFKDMEMRNLNIDFSEFKNIHCQNVIFQISQIAYVFGALEYLLNTKNPTVWVSSHSAQDRKISVDEFKKILPDLINYYTYLEEYFPLANIYISLGQYTKAINAIYNGIDASAEKKDYRMLKFFCKLIVNHGWSSKRDRYAMYRYICSIDQRVELSPSELHNYYLHFGDFRRILLNNEESMSTLYYTINSNIEENDFVKLSQTMKSIDSIIELCCDEKSTHYLEIRHESPFTILIVVSASLVILKTACECIDKVCSAITKVQEVHINQQEIKLNNSELKKIAEEQEKLNSSGIILSGSSFINNKN